MDKYRYNVSVYAAKKNILGKEMDVDVYVCPCLFWGLDGKREFRALHLLFVYEISWSNIVGWSPVLYHFGVVNLRTKDRKS